VPSWSEVESEAPELAARARERLDAGAHKTLATLRADGSPRISGTESFWAQGELWFGSMPRARKADDLLRDPRFALHSASSDPPAWDGDAKLSGRAEAVTDPERRAAVYAVHDLDPPSAEMHLFRADLHEVTLVGLNDERSLLVIEFWLEGRGVTRIERE
jgi:hypothetical protein